MATIYVCVAHHQENCHDKDCLADYMQPYNEVEQLKLQNGVLLTYIERVRKNVSSDNICDCHGRIGEPHKKDCLLIALYALDGCICGVKFGGFGAVHLDDCPGKKVESLGAGLTDESQRETNKLKAEVDKWVERSRVAEDKVHESNRLNRAWERAINECCECGGKGPQDHGVCLACKVYHLARALAEKRKQVCGFWEAGRPCTNDEPCSKHGTMPTSRI